MKVIVEPQENISSSGKNTLNFKIPEILNPPLYAKYWLGNSAYMIPFNLPKNTERLALGGSCPHLRR